MFALQRRHISGLDCVIAEEPDGRSQKTVILCHGFGAPGTDLVPIAQELRANDERLASVRFIFPAAPLELEPGGDSRAWWPISFQMLQRLAETGQIDDLSQACPDELPRCRELILAVVAAEKAAGRKPQEIFVGGFSQGAMLATDVFLHAPEALGGLIVWSGALINRLEWTRLAQARPGQTIVQSHGYWDPVLPFASATALRDLFVNSQQEVQFLAFQGYHSLSESALEGARDLLVRD